LQINTGQTRSKRYWFFSHR